MYGEKKLLKAQWNSQSKRLGPGSSFPIGLNTILAHIQFENWWFEIFEGDSKNFHCSYGDFNIN